MAPEDHGKPVSVQLTQLESTSVHQLTGAEPCDFTTFLPLQHGKPSVLREETHSYPSTHKGNVRTALNVHGFAMSESLYRKVLTVGYSGRLLRMQQVQIG